MEDKTLNLLSEAASRPAICLGAEFPSEAARREHFRALLAEKLRDPAFRATEGFPKGSDEAILALSDPPYYCACPNPWIGEFVAEWEADKPHRAASRKYRREPFAADVSEGKNDPIYSAHSYHTKVPPKAIMRYILHYTEPGDIVFDGFCGTGMTGVAAQLCGDAEAVKSLGYRVDEETGAIYDPKSETPDRPFARLGARMCVLNDLSPAATFIAANYNAPVDVDAFRAEAERILSEVERECGWMYQTHHVVEHGDPVRGMDGKPILGTVNYTVWSDVFVCPNCQKEVVFWDAAVDKKAGKVLDEFYCTHCGAAMTKRNSQRAVETRWDDALGGNVRAAAKLVPVLLNYAVGKKRFEKKPDEEDRAILRRIESEAISDPLPIAELPDGFNTRQPKISHGITHVHQFFTKRNLRTLAALWKKSKGMMQRLHVLDCFPVATKMSRFRVPAWVDKSTGPMKGWTSGTLYVPSLQGEQSIINIYREKLSMILRAQPGHVPCPWSVVSTSSMAASTIPPDSADYIFVDPPFGANLNYSELNYLPEAWLGVSTDNREEAIENEVQQKGIFEYRDLILACLKEAYRVLKPGRWMTVEFSNTSAAVWNGIQSAITDAGFIIANVSALDKKQGSFKAVTTPTAVKQDLVISAYKPDANFVARFMLECAEDTGVWDFVRTHLEKLPVAKTRAGVLVNIPERDPRILFDQVVSFYVRRNLSVPISSRDFQSGLAARFAESDGMFFLPEQKAVYERKRAAQKTPMQGELFVSDESSAIDWLRFQLKKKPQTIQQIQPDFLQQLQAWKKYEKLPELKDLLRESFLCYRGEGPVPPQIHTYLSTNWHDCRNLAADDPKLREKALNLWYVPDPNHADELEQLREQALLREFESYRQERRLRQFRLDVLRAGFAKSGKEKNFAAILEVGGKLPDGVVEEDDKLLMWYNIAKRLGGR